MIPADAQGPRHMREHTGMKPRWLILTAALGLLLTVPGGSVQAQTEQQDRDASNTENSPSLGQAQQNQTQNRKPGSEGNQGLSEKPKEAPQGLGEDRSDSRRVRPDRLSRDQRPPRPERFRR